MPLSPRAFVIGHPIAHSRSPLVHGFWLDALKLPGRYEKIDVAPSDLQAFIEGLAAAGFVGGNVTVPHKSAVMALVDDIDAAARAIGAVNTLWFENGRLQGGNTDAFGFLANLDVGAPGWDGSGSGGGGHAVVLGAGGAARAVVYGLLQRGLSVSVLNRTIGTAEDLALHFGPRVSAHGWGQVRQQLGSADLLVNTTTLGMVGKPQLHLDLAALNRDALVCDIVYVPLETDLLAAAKARGHRTVGGLGMLLHQAVPGFAHWFGQTPVVTDALRALIEADVNAPRL
ncbi:shikimate dehydrogenase [Lichenihabitans psoromatis]|uniref:shikimate dehydrogenase n=1 Tax=Lichenihabitans psoromatis TaxID=2528642 RepID=UPI00103559A4|nr:shikimate dehydrogenase [Lichenihabitans psoromatis]